MGINLYYKLNEIDKNYVLPLYIGRNRKSKWKSY